MIDSNRASSSQTSILIRVFEARGLRACKLYMIVKPSCPYSYSIIVLEVYVLEVLIVLKVLEVLDV